MHYYVGVYVGVYMQQSMPNLRNSNHRKCHVSVFVQFIIMIIVNHSYFLT